MAPPFVSNILRMGSGGGKWTDNFNRSVSSGLGSIPNGPAWQIVTGAWSVNGSRPITATSQGSNPFAIVDPGVADKEVQLTVGAGDALYFRTLNATNWWRLLWEGYQTSSCQQCCSSCCSTCCDTCRGNYAGCCVNHSSDRCTCSTSCRTSGSGCAAYGCPCSAPRSCYYQGTCNVSCNCYSCNCYSCNCYSCNCTYYSNYRARLQRMSNGTLSNVATGSVVTTTAPRVRVVLEGNKISTFIGTTSLYVGTDATHAQAKSCGIGRGASNYNTSAIDDFEVKWK